MLISSINHVKYHRPTCFYFLGFKGQSTQNIHRNYFREQPSDAFKKCIPGKTNYFPLILKQPFPLFWKIENFTQANIFYYYVSSQCHEYN